jgi:hypothetical protein
MKGLIERLEQVKLDFGKVELALNQHGGKIKPNAEEVFRNTLVFQSEIDNWLRLHGARAVAATLMRDLENRCDYNDCVRLGSADIQFDLVRLLCVQAYCAANWSLADRIAALVGRVFCTPNAGSDPWHPAQLVAHFVQKDRSKTTAGTMHEAVRETFGWPIGISYAIRNHFLHDGGQASVVTFFASTSSLSGFQISQDAWGRIEERAKSYGVDATCHRVGPLWPAAPYADLRTVLSVCEQEMDDALGMLVGSASGLLQSHIQYLTGAD